MTTIDPNTLAYYESELKKVFSTGRTQYAPTIKIHANGNGENTKHISLNEHSAAVLISWLHFNFIHKEGQ